ncbi:hypothetical protein [Streptomyces scabiei]|uniref:hypothetical protein n=1 Tax=Streptomyces scabiei TaxID=1930 RepID=UPI0029AF04AE|nr:hypothetical protein [Streptomyces scabiei]MDX2535270.1 hypothetical protein [Streptomyces scabiei]MDX2799755.1 hypothetical protein [Streptomyces scabiei]MDX2858267.1 hypothetical protein [Streptomyces scabiei]MDX3828377.1 hypothetical protein [Streptomyces scabiei]
MEEEEEEGYEVVEGPPEESEELPPNSLTDAEKNAAKTLSEAGIRFMDIDGDYLKFSPNPKVADARGGRAVFLPREDVRNLRSQLESGVNAHSELMSIAIPSNGYLEIAVQSNGLYVGQLASVINRLSPEGVPDCRHSNGESELLCSRIIRPRERGARLHLQESAQRPCLEISTLSPAALLWATTPRMRAHQAFNAPMSLKIHFAEAMLQKDMEAHARELVSSLFYELDVRNGVRLRTRRWPSSNRPAAVAYSEDFDNFARYPETKVNAEMSTLFGFAGSVIENPPLSFLSYYQVLEFYFPAAVKRTALRQLGKELSDPRFSRSDREDLLRVLKIGERSLNATESSQLRTLLEECVRTEKVESFFAQSWGEHFTKTGPLKGVSVINPKNTQSPLANQVADRIYKIRNRIVHAKDDPKFEDVPALLPQSEEADALGPDIALVRLLASEVILDSQAN